MLKKHESEVNLGDQRLVLIVAGHENFCLLGYSPV
jgi:hypothetical protein